MKSGKRICQYCYTVIITVIITFSILIILLPGTPGPYAFESGGKITPVDVFYLAKSIDDSLISLYDLRYEFKKKKLSNNIRPRNSYQKLLTLADEFNLLHYNAIDRAKLDRARKVDVVNTRPADLYNVLSLIKGYLDSRGAYIEHTGERLSKTPSDVTHMLRQISYHHIEIAKQKNIPMNWSTPPQVYEAIMQDILPVVHTVAEEVGYKHNPFDFPIQPVKEIVPRNLTKLLQNIYKNISAYYINKEGYDPLVLIEVNDCDDIEPGDSFDLIKAISAELKAMSGTMTLDSETAARYGRWKNAKSTIAPGDVYRLLQYNYILSKRILESKG